MNVPKKEIKRLDDNKIEVKITTMQTVSKSTILADLGKLGAEKERLTQDMERLDTAIAEMQEMLLSFDKTN